MDARWHNQHVIILGGARQGLAAARWLVDHGAVVTINDRRTEAEMSAARQALSGTPVRWVLGSHPLEILDQADLVCLSGGVPLDNPVVVEAMRRGMRLTNDTQIFLEVVPCPTIGITGSAGKTTTTALVGAMAKNARGEKAHVGGNIGDPLLNHVDAMQSDDLAILEISSFQLEQMTLSTDTAAVLNITPNHLDRHGTMKAYTAAKRRLLDFQKEQDIAVLCRDDDGSWMLQEAVRGRLISFGFAPLPANATGTWLDGTLLRLQDGGMQMPVMERQAIRLRGDHNVLNVLAAFAIGHAAGLPLEAMRAAAEDFRGVAHRLEYVGEHYGAHWYNDSIASTPERSMADIRSFDEPIVLLLGGRDKKLPWEELVALCRQRVDHVILFGEASELIARAFGSVTPEQRLQSIERCQGLKEAVAAAARVAEAGDVVLLAPGGTSFDEFRDFEERGERYRQWVAQLS